MDLDALLQTSAKEAKARGQAAKREDEEWQANSGVYDLWNEMNATLLRGDPPDLSQLLVGIGDCPGVKRRLTDLQANTQANYAQRLDTAMGLVVAACVAILAGDATTFLRVVQLRTRDSWAALQLIGQAVRGDQTEQRQPLKVKTWQEARVILELMIDRGLQKGSKRELAKQLRCSEGLIRKAIGRSAKCREWASKQQPPPIDSRKVIALTDRTLDNLTAASQPPLPDDEAEHALREILEAAEQNGESDKAAQIRAMDPASRQELARTYLDQFADRRSGNRIAGHKA